MRSYLKNLGNALFGREIVVMESTHEPANRGYGAAGMRSFAEESDILPDTPFELIDFFKLMATTNPDVSQAVQKIVAIGNPGHSLEMTGSDRACKSAVDELNRLARTAFDSNAGADWFINQQFWQIFVTGALSQETVPTTRLSGIEQVYQVPVKTIRFKLQNNRYVPFQQTWQGDKQLNPSTYSYIPLMCNEGSPYGIIPMLAAGKYLLYQMKQWKSIDEYTTLWGLLGYMHMTSDIKQGFQETEAEYKNRAERILVQRKEAFKKSRVDGIASTLKNVEINHHNISKNAGQIDPVIRNTEHMVFSGIDIDPAMAGRSYSTTETYATVCYQTLLGKIKNIQRMIKRANEHSYNLHLVMSSIPASCSISFKQSPSLKAKDEAETSEIKQRAAIARRDAGIIDNDQLARELGYEKATGTSQKQSLTFEYNKSDDKYVFMRPSIEIHKDSFSKKKLVPLTKLYVA
ncbi:MAG: hypothetical protein JXK07_10050 [Spirochaetes bacterium]|nr:hypothetical protein [Spirochaetota bacterium]MBN2771260.1 hypothetical protein [Spirochaetota bacterium]